MKKYVKELIERELTYIEEAMKSDIDEIERYNERIKTCRNRLRELEISKKQLCEHLK